jgi:hypothetical protein
MAGAELVVAFVVIAVVAVTTSGRLDTSASTPPSPALTSWWQGAVPVVTNLVGDLTAIERDTNSAVNANPASLGSDFNRLRQDLVDARALPAPPGRQATALWSMILAQFAAPQRTLAAAASTLSPATVALAHVQFAAAGNALVQLGEQLQAETA